MLDTEIKLAKNLQEIFQAHQAKETADGSIRIHAHQIETHQLLALASLAKEKRVDVKIKRSGTGVSVIART